MSSNNDNNKRIDELNRLQKLKNRPCVSLALAFSATGDARLAMLGWSKAAIGRKTCAQAATAITNAILSPLRGTAACTAVLRGNMENNKANQSGLVSVGAVVPFFEVT